MRLEQPVGIVYLVGKSRRKNRLANIIQIEGKYNTNRGIPPKCKYVRTTKRHHRKNGEAMSSVKGNVPTNALEERRNSMNHTINDLCMYHSIPQTMQNTFRTKSEVAGRTFLLPVAAALLAAAADGATAGKAWSATCGASPFCRRQKRSKRRTVQLPSEIMSLQASSSTKAHKIRTYDT